MRCVLSPPIVATRRAQLQMMQEATGSGGSESQKAKGVDDDDEEGEELEDVPCEAQMADPLLNAWVNRVIAGNVILGQVGQIQIGKVTKERLDCVKYADNDRDHLAEQQVQCLQSGSEVGANLEFDQPVGAGMRDRLVGNGRPGSDGRERPRPRCSCRRQSSASA